MSRWKVSQFGQPLYSKNKRDKCNGEVRSRMLPPLLYLSVQLPGRVQTSHTLALFRSSATFSNCLLIFLQPTAVTMKCDDQFPLNFNRSIETTCENRSYTVIISVPFTMRDGLYILWVDSSDSNKIFKRALGIMSCKLTLKAVADQSFLFTCF